jgi:hypothetical protein
MLGEKMIEWINFSEDLLEIGKCDNFKNGFLSQILNLKF